MPSRTPVVQRSSAVGRSRERAHQPSPTETKYSATIELGDLGRAVGRLVDHPVGAGDADRAPPASTSTAGCLRHAPSLEANGRGQTTGGRSALERPSSTELGGTSGAGRGRRAWARTNSKPAGRHEHPAVDRRRLSQHPRSDPARRCEHGVRALEVHGREVEGVAVQLLVAGRGTPRARRGQSPQTPQIRLSAHWVTRRLFEHAAEARGGRAVVVVPHAKGTATRARGRGAARRAPVGAIHAVARLMHFAGLQPRPRLALGVGRAAVALDRPRCPAAPAGPGRRCSVHRLGSDSFMIVRSAWPYCRCSGPVVYGMSYFSHSARTLTAISG